MAEENIYSLLAAADSTYKQMPSNIKMLVEQVSQAIPDFGARLLRRKGPGTEFFDARPYERGQDDPRRIHAKLSAKVGQPMVVENEAQISQRFYMWRDPSDTMNFSSDEDVLTKKNAAEVMMLAMARHLTKNEEAVGLLDSKGVYRGGTASGNIATKLHDVRVITGDAPFLPSKPPKHSKALMFSDCIGDLALIEKRLRQLRGMEVTGTLVMILDPQEIEFNYDGYVDFRPVKGDLSEKFKRVENIRTAYLERIAERIDTVKGMAEAAGFNFVFQRTDKPLHEGLMKVYGIAPEDYTDNPVQQLINNK
jgi:hypothetical protein